MSAAKPMIFSGRAQLLNWAVRKLGQFGPMPCREAVERAMRGFEREGLIRIERLPDGRVVVREGRA